ncbi:MAG TPA: alternative ribosome rescue aminoacyl-tRNA hydrolase ArfB [Prolixibacteraceae bacterium]|nr:alternative ribosome rescue aminoacyl-tRNA hydrolase ArfB [Prolixibacteraceae bacterium]
MSLRESQKQQLESELNYSATKSGGPGGQNVNKVNTSVELRINITESAGLNESQKQTVLHKLQNRINLENELILVSRSARSQWQNKTMVTKKFFELLEKALAPTKKRIKTKPTATARKKRLENKKKRSQKKDLRKPPEV